MKGNDWIKDLHDKEKAFEQQPPEGLWEGIEAGLDSTKTVSLSMWLRRCAAVVIPLLIAVGVWYGIDQKPTDHDTQELTAQAKQETPSSKAKEPVEQLIQNDQQTTKPTTSNIQIPVETKQQTVSSVESSVDTLTKEAKPEETIPAVSETETKAVPQTTPRTERQSTPSVRQPSSANRVYVSPNKPSRTPTVTLYASNTMEAAGNKNSRSYFSNANLPLSDPMGSGLFAGAFPLLKIPVVPEKTHYNLPVRMGMNLVMPLDERWSVESGFVYSILSSNKTWGTITSLNKNEQRLNYIGIPLRLSYNLWKNKHLGLDLTGGGMVEKCVDGKSVTNNTVGASVTSTEERVSENRPQWSLALSFGVHYDFTQHLGVFLEPGLSYYIDNKSSIVNVYKEKPLNLDLKLGLRVRINE